jgi:hypothetical protein
MTALQARQTLVGIRGVLGAFALLLPRVTGRIFGIDPEANPAAPYLARLFGIRELFMVAPFLDDELESTQQYALEAGVVVDATDAAAGVLAGATGALPKRAAVMATGTALFATALGILALGDD